MKSLRYTLITDGSSDRAFIPILNWLLIDLECNYTFQNTWADFSRLPHPPKSLTDKITLAIDLYPCDLLFIHRDAEKEPRKNRLNEIYQAIAQTNIKNIPVVCVIPVRMLEAWLLFNEIAIRKAAGNPNGKCQIQLPALNKIESLLDPKNNLIEFLKIASELKGRQLKKFNERQAIHRLANIINDFSPLYKLSAFRELKKDLSQTLSNQGWL